MKIADVAADDFKVGRIGISKRQIGHRSGAEVIQDPHAVAVGEETRGQVGSDESGTAGHEKEVRQAARPGRELNGI